jgi:hypothetical protein
MQSTLAGEWEWLKSTGGFGGLTVTPDSARYSSREIHFSVDDEFSFYRADTLVLAGQYSLTRESGKTIVKYSTGDVPPLTDQWVERIKNDTLILTDRCADCYTSTYKCKK